MRNALIGALIGLARATDGAAVLPATLFPCILQGLHTLNCGGDAAEQLALCHAEKFQMVPDCAVCQSPCGRTADYAFSDFDVLSQPVRELKLQLFQALLSIGETQSPAVVPSPALQDFLLRALFLLGEDYAEEQDVLPLLEEAQSYLP